MANNAKQIPATKPMGVDDLPNRTIASPPDVVTIQRAEYERLREIEREAKRRADEEEKRREHHPGWKHVAKPGERGPRFDGGDKP